MDYSCNNQCVLGKYRTVIQYAVASPTPLLKNMRFNNVRVMCVFLLVLKLKILVALFHFSSLKDSHVLFVEFIGDKIRLIIFTWNVIILRNSTRIKGFDDVRE